MSSNKFLFNFYKYWDLWVKNVFLNLNYPPSITDFFPQFWFWWFLYSLCGIQPLKIIKMILFNTFFLCLAIEPVIYDDPCDPDPCGPNSNPPRVNGDRCDCSCLPEMIGSPPNCRPECVVNSDCPQDKACISRKCQDPCPGLCGVNAYCRVRSHIPICVCNQGYQGDPFSQCYRVTSKNLNTP